MNRYTKIRDFHGARSTGVGSSDMAILAGFSKRYGQTPLTLWRQKIGIDPPTEAGERAEWGHRLEGMVLAKFVESRYGEESAAEFLRYKMRGMSIGGFVTESECRMPGRPYVLAHADLLIAGAVVGENGPERVEPYIVEAKTTGLMAAKRDGDEPDEGYSRTDFSQNGIPAKVFLQVQWQMLAYDIPTAYVAVLVDGGDYREYGPIKSDPRTQEKCLALAERFWQCVEAKTEPKPETWGDVQLMWPETVDKTAMIGGEDEMRVRSMIAEYHTLSARKKENEARLDEIKNALGILIGENSTLVTAEGVKLASSWGVTNEYTSAAKIKAAHPDWYEALKAESVITASTRRDLRPAKIKGEAV